MTDPILGAVLAGGDSRRMGRDKALVPFRGRPLVTRPVEALRRVVSEVVVVSSAGRSYDLPGVETVFDLRPGQGPLAGLEAALAHAAGRAVLVLACDLPFVSPELLAHLLARAPAAGLLAARAWIPLWRGRPQPLCGLYGAGARGPVAARLDRGELAMSGLLAELTTELVAIGPELPFDHADLLRNVNRPHDLDGDPGEGDAPGEGEPSGPAGGARRVAVDRFAGGGRSEQGDLVAVEEPLELRVVVEEAGRRRRHSLAVTMRTPGHDTELAAGFLFSEGALSRRRDVVEIAHCLQEESEAGDNVVDVVLAPGTPFDVERFSRKVFTSSSCGVCGKGSIEQVRWACPAPPAGELRLDAALLGELPDRLRRSQPLFGRTGGLHAAGLFDSEGRLHLLREDVGRHNAVDKIVGALFLADELPASERLLLVSGRASFELVQKCLLAGMPALAAVGAPSSLAVDLARDCGMTLVGFLRRDRFNVYSGGERITGGAGS